MTDRIKALDFVLTLAKARLKELDKGLNTHNAWIACTAVETMLDEAKAMEESPALKARALVDALEQQTAFPFKSVMGLSTSHVSEFTGINLNKGLPGVTSDQISHGWLVWVPEDFDEARANHYPEDLLTVLEWAKGFHVGWVWFDADAPTVDALPTYDW